MLTRIHVQGFKSLRDIDVALAPLVVVWGPNAVGKSNLLEAIQLLSRIVTERTLSDAFAKPLRGWPIESFSLPRKGLPALLSAPRAELALTADIEPARGAARRARDLRYSVTVRISPGTGVLSIRDEFLAELKRDGGVWSKPRLERTSDKGGRQVLQVRRTGQRGHPNFVDVGLNHTAASNLQYSGKRYAVFDRLRAELQAWRGYYLDPLDAMRAPTPPRDVDDIGSRGENLAAFLYRLKHAPDARGRFDAVRRTLCATIPSIESLDVSLDEKRGNLDVEVVDDGTPYSLRVLSEGTLRVLGLCALAASPWPSRLVAFEEPENGVHPQRLRAVADLLVQMSLRRQVIVSTHSPLFLQTLGEKWRHAPETIRFFVTRRAGGGTSLAEWTPDAALFAGPEIDRGLAEHHAVADLIARGWLDA